ncbi:glycosyltransferase family 4 protein [Burkholderia sp. 22PA0099]|uniref:glycosyltransferase family 4 protein n=1 Tax=Burkholderia sp. 22PA0099 TaxID=3237372 RepID=UPI0039C495B5
MRIAIVTHTVRHNDGQGRVNYEIARAALAEQCEVTLIASHVAQELLDHPRVRWIPVQPARFWPSNLLRQQVFALKSALWINRHRNEFDVLHVNGFISWVRADVNTAHFVHGGWFASRYYPFSLTKGLWSAYQYIYTRANTVLERWAYRRSRAIVAVSGKVADEIRRIGIDGSRIGVIYNGVDAQAFSGARPDRVAYGLPEGAFMLLFVGDLRTPRKNLGTVLKALTQLPEHVHLAVAGFLPGSPYPDEARALGIASRVHFLGLVKTMPQLMSSVDAYVFPSRYEAMSLSLLEAMAAGLPVVTARTAGGAEIIHADCGIVLDDPDDPAALAGAIGELARSRERCREMGAAARTLMNDFGWSQMGAQYLALYRQLNSLSQPSALGGPATAAVPAASPRPAPRPGPGPVPTQEPL